MSCCCRLNHIRGLNPASRYIFKMKMFKIISNFKMFKIISAFEMFEIYAGHHCPQKISFRPEKKIMLSCLVSLILTLNALPSPPLSGQCPSQSHPSGNICNPIHMERFETLFQTPKTASCFLTILTIFNNFDNI